MAYFVFALICAVVLSPKNTRLEGEATVLFEGVFVALRIRVFFGLIKFRIAFALTDAATGSIGWYMLPSGKVKQIRKKRKYESGVSLWDILSLPSNLKLEQLEARLVLGMKDAAKCALVSGAFKALFETVGGIFSPNTRAVVEPRFGTSGFRLDLTGIARLDMTKIILEVFKLMLKKKSKKTIKEVRQNVQSTSD